MEKLILETQKREAVGKAVQQIRQAGLVPAVLYGHGVENINLSVDGKKLTKMYEQAGENTLVDLVIDQAESVPVLINAIQYDSVTGQILHVDFYKIKAGEKITTEVELIFIGESKVIKESGGTLLKSMDQVKIECLPRNLIHQIEVDISVLDDFEKAIHVKDLNVPAEIKILDKEDEVVATVTPPRAEEKAETEIEESAITEKPLAGKEEKTADSE
ncbi:MAG: 50S ribosomal protein L25 [Patescibacteria group bacterium]|nr:50S ribosomal protein L25 [Patescibacteria group bacterium]